MAIKKVTRLMAEELGRDAPGRSHPDPRRSKPRCARRPSLRDPRQPLVATFGGRRAGDRAAARGCDRRLLHLTEDASSARAALWLSGEGFESVVVLEKRSSKRGRTRAFQQCRWTPRRLAESNRARSGAARRHPVANSASAQTHAFLPGLVENYANRHDLPLKRELTVLFVRHRGLDTGHPRRVARRGAAVRSALHGDHYRRSARVLRRRQGLRG